MHDLKSVLSGVITTTTTTITTTTINPPPHTYQYHTQIGLLCLSEFYNIQTDNKYT